MVRFFTVVNILPVGKLRVSLLDGDVPAPFLHLVQNALMDDRLKFPGEEYLSTAGRLELLPVLGEEVVGAAATPVHDVLVLTLAALLPLPVGEVEVVVDVGHAVVRVPKDCVEERLCWEESVAEDLLQAGDQLVTGAGDDD